MIVDTIFNTGDKAFYLSNSKKIHEVVIDRVSFDVQNNKPDLRFFTSPLPNYWVKPAKLFKTKEDAGLKIKESGYE